MINLRKLSGQTLNNYILEDVIGVGAMGAVYRAHDTNLERDVALKVLTYFGDEAALTRFNREAKLAASLEHSHIVPVYDYGTANDISYVTMRLLTGGSLKQRLERSKGPLAIKGVLRLTAQLASALDYAQERTLVHRDIKPSNIVLDQRGSAYIVDFGLAKLTSSDVQLTASEMIVGTPTYMAPEQWQNRISSAVDQYALAVMVYEMLTGLPPFQADNPVDLLMQHSQDPVPVITRPEVTHAMMSVLLRALAKEPEERFPSSGAFAKALITAARQGTNGDYKPTNDPPQTAIRRPTSAPASVANSLPPAPQVAISPDPMTAAVQKQRGCGPTALLLMVLLFIWAIFKRLGGAILWVGFFIIKTAMRSALSLIFTILFMALLSGVSLWFAAAFISTNLDMSLATELMAEQFQQILESALGNS